MIMYTVALRMWVLSDQYLVVEKCPDFAQLSAMREQILSLRIMFRFMLGLSTVTK